VLRSHIGHPSPDHTDDHEAHGLAFDAADVTAHQGRDGHPRRAVLGTPDDVVDAYRTHAASAGAAAARRGERARHHDRSTPEWDAAWNGTGSTAGTPCPPGRRRREDRHPQVAIQKALNATLPGARPRRRRRRPHRQHRHQAQGPDRPERRQPGGRQLYYGVREHAMGSAMVGMALHGGILPVGGTFFVFLDYMRPPVRLAALSRAKVCFVFTHDSVGVGEDGPTHQPVEHLATLRAIPGLQVIRPADANETAQAWRDAVDHDGPTALVLSRQNVRSSPTDPRSRSAPASSATRGTTPDRPRRHRQRGAVCVAAAEARRRRVLAPVW
jgi:transketolase